MSARFRPPFWLWSVLLVSSLTSVWIAAQRHRVEASARAVHIAVPIEDIRLMAAASGLSDDEGIRMLKDSGMTAVIIAEETFEQLLMSGKMTAAYPGAFRVENLDLFERIRNSIENRFPVVKADGDLIFGPATASSAEAPSRPSLLLPASVFELKSIGVGFDSALPNLVRAQGLSVIGRIANPPAARESSVRWVVEELAAAGAEGAICTGDQVLGWEKAIPVAGEAFNEKGIWYGSVEFGKQAGDKKLARQTINNHFRVHSIQAAEMPQNTVSSILDRYVRAARERNIRVLLVRPPRPTDENPITSFAAFVSKLQRTLTAEGSNAKKPQFIEAPELPSFLRLIPALGGLALAGWLWSRIPLWRAIRFVGYALLSAILIAILASTFDAGFQELALKLAALTAALVFPVWALVSVFANDNRDGRAAKWIAAYFLVCAISIIGGLHVAAMLASLSYMVQVDQFLGVKIAHFVPPLLIGGYLLLEAMRWGSVASGSVRWLDVAIFTLVTAALAFTVLRTGNEAPSAVSGWELQLRDQLDRVLPQRPRTKEAFVGNPALVLALGMAATDRRRYLPLACLVAAIGQASIVNTFCHLHTPIEVSVIRVLTGMVLGGIVGIAIWIAFTSFWRGRLSQA